MPNMLQQPPPASPPHHTTTTAQHSTHTMPTSPLHQRLQLPEPLGRRALAAALAAAAAAALLRGRQRAEVAGGHRRGGLVLWAPLKQAPVGRRRLLRAPQPAGQTHRQRGLRGGCDGK